MRLGRHPLPVSEEIVFTIKFLMALLIWLDWSMYSRVSGRDGMASGCPLCPVAAILRYPVEREISSGQLLKLPDARELCSSCQKMAGADASSFNEHSFRIVPAWGTHASIIMLLGKPSKDGPNFPWLMTPFWHESLLPNGVGTGPTPILQYSLHDGGSQAGAPPPHTFK